MLKFNSFRPVALSAAALATVAVAVAFNSPGRALDTEADAPPARPVKLITLSEEAEKPTRRFFGRIAAKRTVDLAFQVGGQIMKIDIEEGERVEQGALIAELDLEPFTLARDTRRLEREKAERAFDRLERLGPQTTSQRSIDDAETDRDLAQVREREAERNLEKATLLAPFEALVASRNMDAFTTVQAGAPIVRLHDMSEVRIEINVPELLFRQAQGAQDFDLYALLVGDETRYPLESREFNAETTSVGQSFIITLAFVDAPSDRLLPGATATVVAAPVNKGGGVYVPSTALIIAPDGAMSVMLFQPNAEQEGYGTVTQRAVTVEATADGRLRLVSGVEIGDRIVGAGPASLADGETVRIFEGLSE